MTRSLADEIQNVYEAQIEDTGEDEQYTENLTCRYESLWKELNDRP